MADATLWTRAAVFGACFWTVFYGVGEWLFRRARERETLRGFDVLPPPGRGDQ
jgi:hypothetical protein